GALARARRRRRRPSDAHLLARPVRLFRDEERPARGASRGPVPTRQRSPATSSEARAEGTSLDSQSAPVVLPRSALTAPRRVFSSTRRTLDASVGRVARRRFGRAFALTSTSANRAR